MTKTIQTTDNPSGFQPMPLGGLNAGQAVIPPTVPPSLGFVSAPPDLPDRVLSILNAVVVRIGDIGGGRTLLGIVGEREEPVEDQIVYGLSADSRQVRSLEDDLGR